MKLRSAALLLLVATLPAQAQPRDPGLDPSGIRLPSATDLSGEWRVAGRDERGSYQGSARLVRELGAELTLVVEVRRGDRTTTTRHPARHVGATLVARQHAGEATYDLSSDGMRLVRRGADQTLWRPAPRTAAAADPARVAAALRDLSRIVDHRVDARRVTDAASAERASAKFVERMKKLEGDWTKRTLAADRDPAKRGELLARFGELEDALSHRGLSARDIFEAASAGPVALADRLRGTPALYGEVWDLIERTSDELLELARTQAATRLDMSRAERGAVVDQAHGRAVTSVREELDGLVAAGRLDPAQRNDLLDQAVRRLDAVRQREVDRSLFPTSLTIPIGTPAWEQAMDQVLGPRRSNQEVQVIVDPGEYHAALLRVLDAADSKLFLSLMMFEPDRKSLELTDALSMKVRRAEEVVSSLSIINRISARALGMPWDEYTALRARLSARDIRDLRIAQARLGGGLALDSAEVVEHALEVIGKLPEKERIALSRSLFPTDDVKVLLDGKLADMKLLSGILDLVGIALNPTAVPMKLLTGGVRGNLRTAVGALGNDAEPMRYVREVAGHPLRSIEDTAHFVLHPIRFAYGDARDLHDVGVEVAYENRLFDGTNLRELLGLNHEKVVLARTKEGTIQAVISGNNIGAKHFPTGDGRYLWHDAGVWVEGGVDSVADDLVRYQVRHWNDVVRAEGKLERLIGDAKLPAWLPTAGGVGDVSARIVYIEPGRHRSFAAAVLSGISAADKGIEIVMPFLGSEAVLDQLGATADRWLEEGWEPSRTFDPKDPACWADPKCRRFVVVLPGWLDGGFSQFGTWRSIHRLLDRGVQVMRWRPDYGVDRSHDGAVYDRKAMLHAKAGRFYGARGRGFCFVGSGNLMTPVIELGIMRDLSLYSDDARIMASLEEKLIAPTLAQSVPAKRPSWPFRLWNEAIGLITRPFQ